MFFYSRKPAITQTVFYSRKPAITQFFFFFFYSRKPAITQTVSLTEPEARSQYEARWRRETRGREKPAITQTINVIALWTQSSASLALPGVCSLSAQFNAAGFLVVYTLRKLPLNWLLCSSAQSPSLPLHPPHPPLPSSPPPPTILRPHPPPPQPPPLFPASWRFCHHHQKYYWLNTGNESLWKAKSQSKLQVLVYDILPSGKRCPECVPGVCESRSGRPGFPVHNKPGGFCGCKTTFEEGH